MENPGVKNFILFRWVRSTKDWMEGYATKPAGPVALFVFALAESSFFPIPPDLLLIPLCLFAYKRSFNYAWICTIGSVIGGLIGYSIGYFLWYKADGSFTWLANGFFDFIPGFTHELFEKIKVQYGLYDFWIVFLAGFTPIPYKVITITAGVFQIDLLMFTVASAIGRGGRFFLIAWLFYKWGPNIKPFIDKYLEILVVVFTVLLIGGFVAIKFFTG